MNDTLLGWSWLAIELDPLTQTRSPSEAFLRKAFAENSRLILYRNTLAIQIQPEKRVVSGVKVESEGLFYSINARRAVILSAGMVCLFPLYHG